MAQGAGTKAIVAIRLAHSLATNADTLSICKKGRSIPFGFRAGSAKTGTSYADLSATGILGLPDTLVPPATFTFSTFTFTFAIQW